MIQLCNPCAPTSLPAPPVSLFFLFNSSSLPTLLWHREVAQIPPFSAQNGFHLPWARGQHQGCPSLPGLRVEELFWMH